MYAIFTFSLYLWQGIRHLFFVSYFYFKKLFKSTVHLIYKVAQRLSIIKKCLEKMITQIYALKGEKACKKMLHDKSLRKKKWRNVFLLTRSM